MKPLVGWFVVLALPALAARADDGASFWAFRPPKKPALPTVRDGSWPRGSIDRFLLARLEAAGLAPGPDADRRTLVRRAFFDLVGLPPSPAEVDSFVHDAKSDADAFAALVDRLLGAPHFGERWGRHWLDVVRFAESTGGGRTRILEDAWRYRDYVIDALNRDKPYDRFLTEQLAGDLLEHDNAQQRAAQLTATGFLVLGPTNYELQDKELLRMEVIDEQLDTMGRAFLGLSIGCARCHDHKFDPVSTEEYYALAGIFRSTKTLTPGNVSGFVQRPLWRNEAHRKAVQEHERKVKALQGRIKQAKARDAVNRLEAKLKALRNNAPPAAPLVMAVTEQAKPEDCALFIRGNVHTPGKLVPRGFIAVLQHGGPPPTFSDRASGRRELAAWLTGPDHPLTARVMVNRIWHHLFGAGLVRTPDNFGTTGEPPTHPALLDWLAVRFVDTGWSIKTLIRKIMLSRVYQLDSAGNVAADPDNRLLSHASRRRLDAEAIRDAILSVSGQLDRTVGGTAIRPGTKSEFGYQHGTRRRSVYVPAFRNTLDELLAVFDVADPNLVVGRRASSTVPTQALYLMNSPFILEQARAAAAALLAGDDEDDVQRIERAYRHALGRPPSPQERGLAGAYLKEATRENAQDARLAAWAGLYRALFSCLDFRYLN